KFYINNFLFGAGLSLCIPLGPVLFGEINNNDNLTLMFSSLVIGIALALANSMAGWFISLRLIRMLPMSSLQLAFWILALPLALWLGCIMGILLFNFLTAPSVVFKDISLALTLTLPLALFSTNLLLQAQDNTKPVFYSALACCIMAMSYLSI